MSKILIDAITEMREEDVLKITNELIESGTPPVDILEDCRIAMGIIGERFEAGDCFVPELILAGEMLTQVSEIVKPLIHQESDNREVGQSCDRDRRRRYP